MLHHVALVAGCMVHGSVETGISVRTTLVLDVPASAMSSCDGSEQLGCGPSGAATQRRFRLHSRLPARRPPAMTSSTWAAGLCASRSHSRTSFMSRRILSWHSASAVGGASEGRPARMQSRAGNARAAIIGVIQMSPERSRAARRSESESDRPPGRVLGRVQWAERASVVRPAMLGRMWKAAAAIGLSWLPNVR